MRSAMRIAHTAVAIAGGDRCRIPDALGRERRPDARSAVVLAGGA